MITRCPCPCHDGLNGGSEMSIYLLVSVGEILPSLNLELLLPSSSSLFSSGPPSSGFSSSKNFLFFLLLFPRPNASPHSPYTRKHGNLMLSQVGEKNKVKYSVHLLHHRISSVIEEETRNIRYDIFRGFFICDLYIYQILSINTK